jgi:tetratricopeptide (TPR) repeat protein
VGVRLAGALWRYWWMRGHYREGRGWLEAALARGDGAAAERAKALYGAGSLATEQGDYDQATALLESALAAAHAAGDGVVAALALTDLGSIARQQGAYQRAAELHDQALALRTDAGDRRGIAVSFGNLGLALLYQGHYDRAEELLTNAATAFRELGDAHSFITTTSNLALAAVMRGEFARARGLVESSLAGYRALGDHQGMADDLVTLGLAARGESDRVAASEHFAEALDHARHIGYQLGEAAALHRLGLVALESGNSGEARMLLCQSLRIVGTTGDFEEMAGIFDALAHAVAPASPEHAARCLGMATALRDRCGTRRPPADEAAHERASATIKQHLGEQAFAKASAAGRALSLEQAVAAALAFADEHD